MGVPGHEDLERSARDRPESRLGDHYVNPVVALGVGNSLGERPGLGVLGGLALILLGSSLATSARERGQARSL